VISRQALPVLSLSKVGHCADRRRPRWAALRKTQNQASVGSAPCRPRHEGLFSHRDHREHGAGIWSNGV